MLSYIKKNDSQSINFLGDRLDSLPPVRGSFAPVPRARAGQCHPAAASAFALALAATGRSPRRKTCPWNRIPCSRWCWEASIWWRYWNKQPGFGSSLCRRSSSGHFGIRWRLSRTPRSADPSESSSGGRRSSAPGQSAFLPCLSEFSGCTFAADGCNDHKSGANLENDCHFLLWRQLTDFSCCPENLAPSRSDRPFASSSLLQRNRAQLLFCQRFLFFSIEIYHFAESSVCSFQSSGRVSWTPLPICGRPFRPMQMTSRSLFYGDARNKSKQRYVMADWWWLISHNRQ